ncbi:MAG: cytochrome C oxidase subunit IV family protein [Bacteriovoracaceae bacterium]|nr:cytochrome C oxidase subunit IV family protein [Bacteriovoracaceae bacterium]
MATGSALISPESAKKSALMHLSLFLVLIVVTLAQLYLKSQNYEHLTNAFLQTAMALFKVFIVAFYFMHLKEEAMWLKFIAILPVFAVLYTVFVVVESIVR